MVQRETCRACDGSGQLPDTRDPFERNAPRVDCQACGGIGETPARVLDCGHGPTPGAKPGTGYAFDSLTDRTLCYSCAAVQDWQRMRAGTEHFAYVSTDGHSLTTWDGTPLAIITGHSVSRSGWHGSEVHRWWIIDRNGDRWHGANGGPGMCINVRRIGEWIGK